MDSSSSTSKRARAPTATGGNQVASCLVDGCKSDLSKCRDYHRRHKVCELHSKTPRVTIGGREQRFCQQCSRFHSLGEFDEGKRSCRKRLEGHNRRRRKAQPDSVAVKPGNFLSSGRGGSRFMAFSGSSPTMNIIPASSVSVSASASASASASVVNSGLYRQSQDVVLGGGGGGASSHSPRQFPFLQGQASSSTSATSNNLNLNLNHLTHLNLTHHHHHLSSALSLLSSETPEIGLTHIGIDMVQQQQPSFIHYNSNHLHASSDSDMMPISSTTLHQDVFQDGSCSATGPQQTLSFLWE